MIVAQDPQGLVFWPEEQVCSMIPEFRNWWRIVHQSGAVAHRPTAPDTEGWTKLGTGYVNPEWMRPGKDGTWLDSADFPFPPGELKPRVKHEAVAKLAHLPCAPHEIYAAVSSGKPREFVWLTDRGRLPAVGRSFAEVVRGVPHMLGLRPKRLWINYSRLRRVLNRGQKFNVLVMDNGVEFSVVRGYTVALQALNLESFDQLYPTLTGRFGSYQLRDWPIELRTASAEFLQKHFVDARMLTGHLIWQRYRYIGAGVERDWADSYGGLWYESMVHSHSRVGFLKVEDMSHLVEDARAFLGRKGGNQDALYDLMYEVLDFFADQCEFFTMRQFGFKDPAPELTTTGELRPEVVLITEKDDVYPVAQRLVREFGVSHYHLQGQPSLLRSEFAAERLAPYAPLHGIAYVDYDVSGHIIGQAAANQLTRYGAAMPRLEFMIGGDDFTAEEKRLYAKPCPASSKALKTKCANWVKQTGGVNGKAHGIHSNHVQPYERVRELFARALGATDGAKHKSSPGLEFRPV
jgi:hypothetical protein